MSRLLLPRYAWHIARMRNFACRLLPSRQASSRLHCIEGDARDRRRNPWSWPPRAEAGPATAALAALPRQDARHARAGRVMGLILGIVLVFTTDDAGERVFAAMEGVGGTLPLTNVVSFMVAGSPIAFLLAFAQTPGKWVFGIRVHVPMAAAWACGRPCGARPGCWCGRRIRAAGGHLFTMISSYTDLRTMAPPHGTVPMRCEVTHAGATPWWARHRRRRAGVRHELVGLHRHADVDCPALRRAERRRDSFPANPARGISQQHPASTEGSGAMHTRRIVSMGLAAAPVRAPRWRNRLLPAHRPTHVPTNISRMPRCRRRCGAMVQTRRSRLSDGRAPVAATNIQPERCRSAATARRIGGDSRALHATLIQRDNQRRMPPPMYPPQLMRRAHTDVPGTHMT